MNNDDRLALVPRTAGQIERIDRGARRVISGMVSDTLALAALNIRRQPRPPRIVIMDDVSTVGEMVEAVIRSLVSDATILRFVDANLAWQELMREDPDLFTTDVTHVGPATAEILRWMKARRAKYPIFVISAWAITKERLPADCIGPGLDVTFIPKPFTVDEFRRQFVAHLRLPREVTS